MKEKPMRIEIKYETSEGGHLMDLDASDLAKLGGGDPIFIRMRASRDAIKTLSINGSAHELELLGQALLDRAARIRGR